MSKIRAKRLKQLIPAWDMPADPVKAVWWFIHWLLKVLVHFFWVLILVMSIFEASLNWNTFGFLSGLVSGMITLLIGLAIWGLLSGILAVITLVAGISHIVSDVKQFQNNYTYTYTHGNPYPFMHTDTSNFKPNPKNVDSTAIKLEEES